MVVDGGVAADERLRRLESLTDAALSRLPAADLLDELLDRVRDVLNVDTAAILLLDAHAHQLVATAAKGLEEEVRRGFRIAVGAGFAGGIAASGRPARLFDVTGGSVVNPILLEQGVRSLLGVPMFADGTLLGVLHVGTLSRREFTDNDVRLLQVAADRAATAGQVRERKLEQAAAHTLQHSLLPDRLPDVAGLDLAARFVPGHEFGVGGDWYDVFPLPSGWVGAVMGDVAGHGLASAIVMGRVRSALRAYTLICDDPAEALTLLDRKVRHFEAGSLTTTLYAMIPPERDRILVSLAGHLPPVLAERGRPAALAAVPVDPPVGIGLPHRPRRTTVLPFPPGAVLLCYTDGLVERRGEVIDYALDRLTAVVTAGPADDVCATVMAAMGADQPTDDVAVMAITRCAGPV